MTQRPRILITNDDGIESRGILALRRALEPIGETVIVAPETNQSAVGHKKTMWRPLRVRERTLADGSKGWSVDGSPTDAVSLAFLGLVPGPFDLVASGINHGANVGDDITYSGTVSAAMEGVINGCPSFAISHEDYAPEDFELAMTAAATVARGILAHGLAPGELLNVNVPAIPAAEARGIVVTRLGKRIYQDELIRREDPRGVPYYWFGGPPPTGEAVPGTDVRALLDRLVSVTPIKLDLTAERELEQLRGWGLVLGG
jgi:5'-nucleotidase